MHAAAHLPLQESGCRTAARVHSKQLAVENPGARLSKAQRHGPWYTTGASSRSGLGVRHTLCLRAAKPMGSLLPAPT